MKEKVCEHLLCCDDICDDELLIIKVGERVYGKLTAERRNEILEHICGCEECWKLILIPMRKELGLEFNLKRHLVAVA